MGANFFKMIIKKKLGAFLFNWGQMCLWNLKMFFNWGQFLQLGTFFYNEGKWGQMGANVLVEFEYFF